MSLQFSSINFIANDRKHHIKPVSIMKVSEMCPNVRGIHNARF